jgi:maltose O-acetyltransferase
MDEEMPTQAEAAQSRAGDREDQNAPGIPSSSLWTRIGRIANEETRAIHWRLRLLDLLLFFLPHFCLNHTRTMLYRLFGLQVGAHTLILGSMELSGQGNLWKKLRIGRHCQITAPLYADLNAEITVGDHVALAHHVVLVTTTHDPTWQGKRCGECRFAPIVIEEGCWIAAGAMILPGVTVGRGSVVAAGSVVTANVPPNTLVGGIPARPIKTLPTQNA